MSYTFTVTEDVIPQLCNAVVIQAVTDFREAKQAFTKATTNYRRNKALAMMEDCKEFFLSERFHLFTTIDGESLYNTLLNE